MNTFVNKYGPLELEANCLRAAIFNDSCRVAARGIAARIAASEAFTHCAIHLDKCSNANLIFADRDHESDINKNFAGALSGEDIRELFPQDAYIYFYRLVHRENDYGWMAAASELPANEEYIEILDRISATLARLNSMRSRPGSSEAETVKYSSRPDDILDNIREGFYVLNLDFELMYINPAMQELLEVDPEEVYGLNFFDGVMPQTRGSVFHDKHIMALRSGEYTQFEAYLEIRGNGGWYDVRISPYKDGTAIYLHRMTDTRMLEIQRVANEKKLLESHDLLEKIIDANPEAVFLLDSQGIMLRLNQTAARRLDNTREKLQGMSIFDAIDDESMDMRRRYAERALATGDALSFYDNRNERQYRHYVRPITNADNMVDKLVVFSEDITERLLYEKNNALLAAIVESSENAIIGKTLDGNVQTWNQGAEKMFGYTAAEMIGHHISRIVPAEKLDEIDRIRERILDGKSLIRMETIRVRKSGGRIYISLSLSPIIDKSGNIIGISAICRDVTNQRLAMQALRDSEERFRRLAENARDVIFRIEYYPFIHYSYVSPACETLSGYRLEDFYANPDLIFEMMHPDDLPAFRKIVTGRQFSQEPAVFRWVGRNGDMRYVELIYSPIYEQNGQLSAIEGIARDIQRQKEFENSLIESKQLLEQTFFSMREGLLIIDAKSEKIIDCNPAALRLFDIERKYMGAINAFCLLIGPDHDEKMAETILPSVEKQGFYYKSRDEHIRTGGQPVTVEWSLAPLTAETGGITGWVALVRDITRRTEIERELKKSRERLRNLTRHIEEARESERKEIAYEIHDELGQSLTALKFDIAWLMKKLPPAMESELEKIAVMSQLTDRTINHVRQISSQLRPSILDHFGLGAALEWQAEEFEKHSGIKCHLYMDINEEYFKDPMSTTIYRIFQGIITNISRHSKASRVTVEFREYDSLFELRIIDNGIGIPIEKITSPDSFGLMAIRERAYSIGADINIEGRPGKGTSHRLIIPKKED